MDPESPDVKLRRVVSEARPPRCAASITPMLKLLVEELAQKLSTIDETKTMCEDMPTIHLKIIENERTATSALHQATVLLKKILVDDEKDWGIIKPATHGLLMTYHMMRTEENEVESDLLALNKEWQDKSKSV